MGRRAEPAISRWRMLTEFDAALCPSPGWLAGVDEAGRGPLAGPVVAAAVVLADDAWLPGVDDSKRVPPRLREALCDRIVQAARAVGVAMVAPAAIDAQNILRATETAMRLALARLPRVDVCISDAVALAGPWQLWALARADGRSASVAAASIVAKVMRDRYMEALDAQYPAYGFARHKGYGTAEHWAALQRWGPCPAHRLSFLRRLAAGEAIDEDRADR